jgi:hypothetical protein
VRGRRVLLGSGSVRTLSLSVTLVGAVAAAVLFSEISRIKAGSFFAAAIVLWLILVPVRPLAQRLHRLRERHGCLSR